MATLEIAATLLVLLVVAFLFVTEFIPPPITAISAAASLMVLGIVTPVEGFSGFSNEATITVMCMLILAAAVRRVGLVNVLAHRLVDASRGGPSRFLLVLLMLAGLLSAIINNTPIVAILIPVVVTVAARLGLSPSRFLMPMAFASTLGGMMTLIGTSTTILASNISAELGYGAFSMFTFTRVGLVVFVVGVLYLLLVGHRLLPDDGPASRPQPRAYTVEIVVAGDSTLRGCRVDESVVVTRYDLDVVRLHRRDGDLEQPFGDTELQEGDVLYARASREQVASIVGDGSLTFLAEHVHWLPAPREERVLAEAIVAPGSFAEGEALEGMRFRGRYDALVLAVRKRDRFPLRRLSQVRLDVGDSLLVTATAEALAALKASPDFIVPEELRVERFRRERIPHVVLIFAAIVATATFGWLPIGVSALAGVVLVVAVGALDVREFQQAIRWDVVFLLAGLIPLGVAMAETGAAAFLVGSIVPFMPALHPVAYLAVVYLVTMILTALMSNNASAVLMLPIAVELAVESGFAPFPFIACVTFAATLDFMTPIGYQTHLMVYGPGQYRFVDFLRVGAPLNALCMVASVTMIALVWPP